MAKSTESFLTFTLQQEVYALAVADTQEIIESEYVKIIPGRPPGIHGLVHHRGRLITVFHLFPEEEGYSQVIVLNSQDRHLGLWVPSKIKSKSLDLLRFEAQEDRPEYLKGFIDHDGKLYNVLTCEGLVNHFNQLLLQHIRGAS